MDTNDTAQKKTLNLSEIVVNNGQIEGLPRNPRFIRDNKYKALIKSLEDDPEMMDLREILVYPYQGKYVIIGGNMRYRAAKELGWTELPCKIIPPHITPDKLRAYTIKDNNQFGEWDWDIANNEWDVDEWRGFGIDFFGFEEGADPSEDDYPEKKLEEDDFDPDEQVEEEKIWVKEGDLFDLGGHRLICGDCTKDEVLSALMDGQLADLIVTDPPYNVDMVETQKRKNVLKAGKNFNVDRHSKINNDTLSKKDFSVFCKKYTATSIEYLKNGGVFYFFQASKELATQANAIRDAGEEVRTHLVWVKSHFVISFNDYQPITEQMLYGWKKGAPHYFANRKDISAVIDDLKALLEEGALEKQKKERLVEILKAVYSLPASVIYEKKPQRSDLHPTMKPVKLIGRLIGYSSRPQEIVLDPFGGSGTTMIACEQLGRVCRMVEIDPIYCQIILKRYEDYTGGVKATKIKNIYE